MASLRPNSLDEGKPEEAVFCFLDGSNVHILWLSNL